MRLVEQGVFALHPFSYEHVVLRLLYHRRNEVQALGDAVSAFNLAGRPLGGDPVEALAQVDQPVETAEEDAWRSGRWAYKMST